MLLVLPALLTVPPGPLAATEPEDELKAATVLTFLRHAEWPKAPVNGTLTVGILGRNSMVKALQRNLEGKVANSHPVHVVAVQRPSECQDCQALFVAVENRNELKQMGALQGTSGLLLMGESDHFLESGGAVNLMIVDGHMSFEVSQQALDRSAITISSKLLRYGRVRGRQPE